MKYTRSDGSIVDLTMVFGTRQNTVKYALKLIDIIFLNKGELQDIDVRRVDEDPRIKAIYSIVPLYTCTTKFVVILFCTGVVRNKFNFSIDEMSVIWPPIHDSILSKRRNQRKQLLQTLQESKNEGFFNRI